MRAVLANVLIAAGSLLASVACKPTQFTGQPATAPAKKAETAGNGGPNGRGPNGLEPGGKGPNGPNGKDGPDGKGGGDANDDGADSGKDGKGGHDADDEGGDGKDGKGGHDADDEGRGDTDVGMDDGARNGGSDVDVFDDQKTITKGTFVCLGGPAGNLSFLLHDAQEARGCMQIANSQPCTNDPRCGPEYHLQMWPCECSDPAGIPFDDPSGCFRFNPQKSVPKRVPQSLCRTLR